MSKVLKIVIGILILLLLLGGACVFAYFYFFVGITPEQKYNKCADNCEELMFMESNIPICKLECEEISGYSPSEETSPDIKEKTEQEGVETGGNTGADVYYCEWVWPQKIIIKDTKEVVKECTYDRPYCNPADGTFDNVGCCERENEEYTNCVYLPDL